MSDIEVTNNMCDINSVDEEITPKTELYSLSKEVNEMDALNLDTIQSKKYNQKRMMLKNNNYNQLSLMKKSFNKVDNDGDGLDDMSIISFLARSDKRVQI